MFFRRLEEHNIVVGSTGHIRGRCEEDRDGVPIYDLLRDEGKREKGRSVDHFLAFLVPLF